MELRLKELELSSPHFLNLEQIPLRYTSDGDNISPALRWDKVPPGTEQLALICHDPDAPLPYGFTHWVLYHIPPQVTELKEGDNASFTKGLNSSKSLGYTGPAPPPGHGIHHYYFWIYALNTSLRLEPGLSHEALIYAIADYVTAQARLVGTYQR